jgi:hypothetical protein
MISAVVLTLSVLVTTVACLQIAGSAGLLGDDLLRHARHYAYARNVNAALAALLWLTWFSVWR